MLPPWLVAAGSVTILVHLAALAVPILNESSGPWFTPAGPNVAEPPQFARSLSSLASPHARYLRLGHSYHFTTSRPGDTPAVELEVRLRYADGRTESLRLPDPNANPWVRHRQELLAASLAPDLPVPPPQAETLEAPNARRPPVAIWALAEEDLTGEPVGPPPGRTAGPLQLRTVPHNLVPRNREVMRPPEWALIVARSYSRYLCRAHGAVSAEIIRSTRPPVAPGPLFGAEAAPANFETTVASFGEVSQ
jgi:hypothetical protein